MGVHVRGGHSLALAMFVLLSAITVTAAPTPIAGRSLTPHTPILIDSDANFTAANGVTSGDGSAGNPYAIEGWDINAANGDGVFLRSTTAHVILRNLFVHDGGPTYVGILILQASNVTVDHVNATSSAQGIYVVVGTDIWVHASNGSSAQGGGIGVTTSTRVVIDDNDVWSSEYGIWVNGSTSATIENNRLHRNGRGVSVTLSPGILISGNVIADEAVSYPSPTMGVGVADSDGAQIVSNTISGAAELGISVGRSTSIRIESNRVTGNAVGAQLTASAGTIFHNRFYFNGVQSSDDNASLWDAGYPTGGNYWSDYAGVDHCRGPAQDDCSAGDGIGDTPYLVGVVIRDRYPLIPFDLPPLVSIRSSRHSALPGGSITFSAAVRDSYGTVVSYVWNFGDGKTGTGAIVDHAFAATGTYSVQVLVTDNRSITATASTSVTVWPAVSFVLVDHSSGFRIPVPSDWQVQKDVTVSGQSIPLITSGTTVDGFRTNVLVAYTSDSGAREDPSYLAALMNGTITELQREGRPAFLADGPTYLSVSGHLAVAFGVGYSNANYEQRAVIVVSAAHGREWVIVLSVAISAFEQANATFDSMVAGFQITAWPPVLVFGLVAGVVAAVAAVVVVLVVRYRRKRPSPAPVGMPTIAPPSMAVRFCASCGAPVPPANAYATFCSSCGKPLQRQ